MFALRKLSSSEVKEILEVINKTYGIKKIDLPYYFYTNNKFRIFIISKTFNEEQLKTLRIQNVGLYFANYEEKQLRLTIEGSQLIGPHATANVVTITDAELVEWMRGESLAKTITEKGFVIIKHNEDYYGCGRKSGEGLANFIPKSRRIKSYRTPEIYE